MKKNGWTDRRAEVAYFLVAMLRDALCVSAVILVWEACHGFHSGYLHIDDIEVRVRDERGGFVRRYDHAGRGELAARDGSDGEDGEWTCAAVFDDDARRLTVTLQHVDARPRRKGSEGKQEVEQAHQDVNHGEDYTKTRGDRG